MSEDTANEGAGEKKRPNANYKLSKTGTYPIEITHHYDRDRRLEKAPKSVQDLYYKEDPPRRAGLFRNAPGGKIQLFTMIVIFLISMMALIITIIGRDGDTHELEGNRVTVQAIRYEGMTIMALRKMTGNTRTFLGLRPGRPAFTGGVSVEISPVSPPVSLPMTYTEPFGNIFFHRINFTEESPEFFRFAIPFDADELELVLSTENRVLSVRVRVE
ncbi:MAG: hypothetical protein FWB78_07385 [Treponema sp.]|nr:hypothetical protein [Treponema sp.]